jgi:hypothetical protein
VREAVWWCARGHAPFVTNYRQDGAERSEHRGDLFARFLDLYRAFDAGRSRFGDVVPLRLAAIALVGTEGDAVELVARVRAYDAELAPHFGWFSGVDGSVRLVLAAALLRTGDDPATFLATLERGRSLMRAAKLPRDGAHEMLAILALRRMIAPQELGGVHVDRVRSIYEEMKRSRWFLTGAGDLTACAMLYGREGTAQQICAQVDAIYGRLAGAPKIWGGEALQTAANLLGLVDVPAEEVVTRFLDVASALRDAGVKVRQSEYDDVAMLSFVPRPATHVAQMVVDYRADLRQALGRMEDDGATGIAANLTFVRMLGSASSTGTLGDAKLLLEMQAIVTWRQQSSGG